MLMGERDWIEVVGEGAVAEWGKDGMGVGTLALATVIVCFVSTRATASKGCADW